MSDDKPKKYEPRLPRPIYADTAPDATPKRPRKAVVAKKALDRAEATAKRLSKPRKATKRRKRAMAAKSDPSPSVRSPVVPEAKKPKGRPKREGPSPWEAAGMKRSKYFRQQKKLRAAQT